MHGREWAAAAAEHLGVAHAHNLPALHSNSTGIWAFDPSVIYGFDEVVLLLLIFACLLVGTACGTKLRRVWRKCASEEAKLRKDADTLGLIGTTARQIALDLDAVGVLHRSDLSSSFWTRNSSQSSGGGGSGFGSSSGFGGSFGSSGSGSGGGSLGMGDLSSQLGDLDALMAGLTNRSRRDQDADSGDLEEPPKAE